MCLAGRLRWLVPMLGKVTKTHHMIDNMVDSLLMMRTFGHPLSATMPINPTLLDIPQCLRYPFFESQIRYHPTAQNLSPGCSHANL